MTAEPSTDTPQASGTEEVEAQRVEPGDTLQFNDGRRLVLRSEHGLTALFQAIQLITFVGNDREHRFPWGDRFERVIR